MMAPRTIGVGPRRPRFVTSTSIGAHSQECRPDGFCWAAGRPDKRQAPFAKERRFLTMRIKK
jgi:hypothetical protein